MYSHLKIPRDFLTPNEEVQKRFMKKVMVDDGPDGGEGMVGERGGRGRD